MKCQKSQKKFVAFLLSRVVSYVSAWLTLWTGQAKVSSVSAWLTLQTRRLKVLRDSKKNATNFFCNF